MIPPPPCFAIENGEISFHEMKERAQVKQNEHVLSKEVVG